MVNIFSNSTINYHIRSISLPNTTHPTSQIVEERLKKLKSSTSAGVISYGLSSLQDLYKSIDDLLNLPLTIQSLSSYHQKEKWGDELLDKSVRLLDICGIAKDMVSQCKDNVRDLQSSLRRGKGITNYFSCITKLKKEAKRSLASLKQIDREIINVSSSTNHHVSTVIRVLQEANSTTSSIFHSIFKFLSLKSCKQKTNTWVLVARILLQKRSDQDQQIMGKPNELEDVNVALNSLCENGERQQVYILQNRMQILETRLEGLENQMEVIFRCMIRSRTTLLNAFSSF